MARAKVRLSRPVRQSIIIVVGVSALSGVVAAQASEAGAMLCSSGVGQLVGLGLGAAVIVLLLVAAFRGTMAFKNIGSGRSDKKLEGREQLVGAGITAAGAFFPAIFGLALDQVGIGAFSCIDWGSIIAAVVIPV